MRLETIVEVGDKVEFTQDYSHKHYPDLYPAAGSKGTVYKVLGHGIFVDWKEKRNAKYFELYIPRDFVTVIESVEHEEDKLPWEE